MAGGGSSGHFGTSEKLFIREAVIRAIRLIRIIRLVCFILEAGLYVVDLPEMKYNQ